MRVYVIVGSYIEEGKALSDFIGVYTNEAKAEMMYNIFCERLTEYDNITLTWDDVNENVWSWILRYNQADFIRKK